MLAGGKRIGRLPLDALQVHEVPGEHRLAFEDVKTPAAKPPAGGDQHSFTTAFRHFDVGGDGVGAIEQQRGIALWKTGHRPGVGEDRPPGRDVGPRRDEARRSRRIQWQHLVLLRFLEEQFFHLLQLPGILGRDVFGLRPVLVQVVEFPSHVVQWIHVDRSDHYPRRRMTLVLAIQPS